LIIKNNRGPEESEFRGGDLRAKRLGDVEENISEVLLLFEQNRKRYDSRFRQHLFL